MSGRTPDGRRQQQRILANLGRDLEMLLRWGRLILAGLVVAAALIGAACGHLVNLISG